jgi:putative MATE family efflux protein
MQKKQSLTEGSVLKTLVVISTPIIFANLLQTAYQLTDTFWVGRLGESAVAAVSISFPILFLIISLGGGLAMAGSILVAQYAGRRDQKMTDHVASQSMLLLVFVSIILGIFGWLIAPYTLNLMGVEQAVFDDALSYMRISFLGIIFMFGFAMYQSLMRGIGEVKTPLYIVFGTVLLNLILDPLFIFGYGPIPAFGVSGAAVASIGTEALAALIGLIILFKGKLGIHIHLADLKPDFTLIQRMFRLGMPASIEHSMRALGMTIMTFIVAGFGTTTIAAFGIGGRILSFVIIPALGLSLATSALVGQNMGANKIKRAEEVVSISLRFGFVVLTLVGIGMFIFANSLAAFFIPGEAEAIASSALFIKIISLSFGFISVQMVVNGAFRAAGNTYFAMILSIVSFWVLQFPLAYLLSYHTSLAEIGIWMSYPVANVIGGAIALFWHFKGGWKNNKVIDEKEIMEEVRNETLIEENM